MQLINGFMGYQYTVYRTSTVATNFVQPTIQIPKIFPLFPREKNISKKTCEKLEFLFKFLDHDNCCQLIFC